MASSSTDCQAPQCGWIRLRTRGWSLNRIRTLASPVAVWFLAMRCRVDRAVPETAWRRIQRPCEPEAATRIPDRNGPYPSSSCSRRTQQPADHLRIRHLRFEAPAEGTPRTDRRIHSRSQVSAFRRVPAPLARTRLLIRSLHERRHGAGSEDAKGLHRCSWLLTPFAGLPALIWRPGPRLAAVTSDEPK